MHLIELRRALHAHAEVGFDLFHTRSIIERELEREGVEYKAIGSGSIMARIGKGTHGILLRADMDALPMREMTSLPFASRGECMHACGHDMHTAMLLGAISRLGKKREKFPFEVRFLFQASEENLCGARDAILYGALEPWDKITTKNDVECKQELENRREYFITKAYSLHCVTALPLQVGTLIVGAGGTVAPASSFFSLTLRGENAHGATPHIGKDALLAMNMAYQALLTLPQRCASPQDSPLLTVGKLKAGEAPNVIPSLATLEGTIRSMSDDTQATLCERAKALTEQIAHAYGVAPEFQITGGAPTLSNAMRLSKEVAASLTACLGEGCVLRGEALSREGQRVVGGSEDFAHFSRRVPSLFIGIAAGDSREGYTHPLHHPEVRFDERSLEIGAHTLELLALFEL